MQQYSYNLVNGHRVANIRGRKFLIDTSMPFTVADRPMLIGGDRFEVAPEVMGLNTAQISKVVGLELDGILGANVIDNYVMKILPAENTLVLDHYLDAFPLEIDIDNLGGMVIMNQTIAGIRQKAFLALGMRLSYVNAAMVEGLEPIGYERDVVGMIGEFETPVYQLPVAIDRKIHNFKFGVVPTQIQDFIEMANVTAAIGSELLQHYAVSLSINDGVLMLDPLETQIH
ncbi:MAG: hypothetical protein V7709_17860 [Halioglobus sp.]